MYYIYLGDIEIKREEIKKLKNVLNRILRFASFVLVLVFEL